MSSPYRRLIGPVAVVAAVAAAAATAADEKLPRRELAPLEQAFAEAVSRVSQPAVMPALGGAENCRGYRLPGFGALFVLSPRLVPERMVMTRPESEVAEADQKLAESIAGMEESLKTATTEDNKRALSGGIRKAKAHRQELRQRYMEQRQMERELQAFASQVQLMHDEAEKARQQAEQAMKMMAHQIGAPMPGAELPSAMGSANAVPPWVVWMQTTTPEEHRTPAQIVDDVREALITVLAAQGATAESLDPDEVVAVAVDFFRSPAVGAPASPARTLVVRAAKSLLDEQRAGKLSVEEARKRFQIVEY